MVKKIDDKSALQVSIIVAVLSGIGVSTFCILIFPKVLTLFSIGVGYVITALVSAMMSLLFSERKRGFKR